SYINRFYVGQDVEIFLHGVFSTLPGKVSKVDYKGRTTAQGSIAHEVEVLLKNPGALHTSEKGTVQLRDSSGMLISSNVPYNFEVVDDIEIKANTSGKISSITVEEDDLVKKGQLLAKLDLTGL